MKDFLKKMLISNKVDFYSIKFGIAKGLKFELNPSHSSQIIWGLNELEIHSYFKKYALKTDFILDIGAAFGYYSLIYRKINRQGKIFAFEPGVGRFHKQIVSNFNKSGYSMENIELIGKMVGCSNDNDFVKIDDYFSNKKNQKILFKIDVDGGELDVLKSGFNSFKNNECYFIIETHSPQLEKDCIEFMKENGYQTKIIKNAWYRKFVPENRPLELNRWFIAYKE